MQFRTFRRRGLGAIACTALVAGALAVPTLLAAPAQAAVVEDLEFSCTYSGNSYDYDTDVNLTAEWDKATGRAKLIAELGNMPNPAPPFVVVPNQAQSSKLEVKVDAAAANINVTGSTTQTFQGGTPIDIPTLTGLASAKAETLSVQVVGFELTAGTDVIGCTLAAPSSAVVVPITFPAGNDLNYICTFQGNKFAYLSDATVTGVQRGPNIRATVQLETMPNTAPVFVTLPNQLHTATLGMTVNGGAAVNAVGTRTANFQGGQPVVIPPMTYDFASTADTVTVNANAITVQVGTTTTIPCALAAPVALPAATVTDYVAVASTTTLGATSPAANAVNLAATLAPADATGKVEFYEGATKVGETALAAGKANLALAGVAAGAHTYTAKFVPTDAWAFAASTSAGATVTVAAPGPSQACTDAGTAVTKAQGVLKKATAADKKAKAAVKKATANVKKAKPAKKKAAQKALKTAKAKAAKAAKALKAAKKGLATAQAKQKSAC